jgi:hypothetical protein
MEEVVMTYFKGNIQTESCLVGQKKPIKKLQTMSILKI